MKTISETIAQLRTDLKLRVDPSTRGPVPLHLFFQELDIVHTALPGLTCGTVTEHLLASQMRITDIGEPSTKLAGFLFAAGHVGMAYVNADDILPRRRFTAAHELGHAVLHRGRMQTAWQDTDSTLLEADDAVDAIEREANQFAAELLMPEELCQIRAEELRQEHKVCPRWVLAYRLASELLVSREAMRYRLKTLEVGDDD